MSKESRRFYFSVTTNDDRNGTMEGLKIDLDVRYSRGNGVNSPEATATITDGKTPAHQSSAELRVKPGHEFTDHTVQHYTLLAARVKLPDEVRKQLPPEIVLPLLVQPTSGLAGLIPACKPGFPYESPFFSVSPEIGLFGRAWMLFFGSSLVHEVESQNGLTTQKQPRAIKATA